MIVWGFSDAEVLHSALKCVFVAAVLIDISGGYLLGLQI